MTSFPKRVLKAVFRGPTIEFARLFPCALSLEAMRRFSGIQLTRREIGKVVTTIRSVPACKLLVFGLGNDSLFWRAANRTGRTTFIEDDVAWIKTICDRDGIEDVFAAKYGTKLGEWRNYLDSDAVYDFELPDSISKVAWDIILVDGPAAWCDDVPGRMKSIAASTRLIRDRGHVFVHDYNRVPEKTLADHFLGVKNLVSVTDALSHFEFVKS